MFTAKEDPLYKKFLIPYRLVFFDLDGTIVPSTSKKGRRIAIALAEYKKIKRFFKENFDIDSLPPLDATECSRLYQEEKGVYGLVMRLLQETQLTEDMKECIGYYFSGLYRRRLTQYRQEDLEYDHTPAKHLQFLYSLSRIACMVLVSYRYQAQYDFLLSLKRLGLKENELFGAGNAFAVGDPRSSSDGAKSRFVGSLWRNQIRAQRRLVSKEGKNFPPIVVGDAVRDIHFAIDIGAIFFGVCDTGEDSYDTLMEELKNMGTGLHEESYIFTSLADPGLQNRLYEECNGYMTAMQQLDDQS